MVNEIRDLSSINDCRKIEIFKYLIQCKDRVAHESALFLHLKADSTKEKKSIKKAITRLVIDGCISFDRKKRIIKLKTNEFDVGEVILKGINQFAIQFKDKKESIKGKHLNGSYVGDTVLYSNKSKTIVGIINKKNNPTIFSCIRICDDIKLIPLSSPVEVDYNCKLDESTKISGGLIISADVEYDKENDMYSCNLHEVIGRCSEENIMGKIVLAANGYDINFPKEVLEEAELTPDRVYESDIEGRVDLRNLKAFTLDCAKRMNTYDDALSIDITPDGNYMVYVHIIDVPHYVKPGMAMWEEARKRAEKIFMNNYRYARNMLPEKLSHGICSFLKGQDRLSKTISLEFDPEGNFVACDFFNSAINVRDNFCTRDADRVYEAGYDSSKEYYNNEYIRDFVLLKHVHKFIKKSSYIEGSDSSSDSMHTVLKDIIEFANEQVANYFPTLPFIYKTFRYPTKSEIEKRVFELSKKKTQFANNFNYVKRNIIDKVLNYYRLPHTDIYKYAIADILSKECSIYSAKNKGHFKYGVQRYTHINSPVRSFPNLVNLSLSDMYNTEFDPTPEAMEQLEEELERYCSEFNATNEKIEKLEHSLSNTKESEREINDYTHGVVTNRKGNRVSVNLPDGEMFRAYCSDSSVQEGSEVIIQINRSPKEIEKFNAKILNYKNT